MKKKHGIGMCLIETPATLIMVLVACVVSVPAILYIGFEYLRYKVRL